MRGVLIAFEGPDGSGKSTVAQHVAEQLVREGVNLVLTREPGGTELGKHVRRILLETDVSWDPVTELLLMCADRAEHVRSIVRPALESGASVITDRYAGSTRAYQGAGLGIDATIVERAIQIATDGLEPHLTLLLDVESAIALERRLQRPDTENEIDRRSVEYHERVRESFLVQARRNPNTWLVLDAAQPLAEVAEHATRAIESMYTYLARN